MLLLLLIGGICYASNIPQPPPVKEKRIDEQQYLKKIADNFNNLKVVTTNPDGTTTGKYGDMLLLVTGGNYYLEICVDTPTGTTFRGVQLTNTP